MTWKVLKTWNICRNVCCECVVQVENNLVLLSIQGKYIQIWNINEEEPKLLFKFGDFQFLEEIGVVSNNRIVTQINENKFAVWSINEPFSKEPIQYLDYTNEQIKGYYFDKERNILILNCKKEFAVFNTETYQKITIIESPSEIETMFKYDKKNVLCSGGDDKSLFYINLDDLTIKDVSKWNIDCYTIYNVIPSRDKKWIFAHTGSKMIMMNIETKEINQFKIDYIGLIYKLLPLDDYHLLSEDNGNFRIWKY